MIRTLSTNEIALHLTSQLPVDDDDAIVGNNEHLQGIVKTVG